MTIIVLPHADTCQCDDCTRNALPAPADADRLAQLWADMRANADRAEREFYALVAANTEKGQ